MMQEKTTEGRREEILQAAIAEFCSCGYEAVSMKKIAQSAGVGKSTIYEYFPSKEALLLEVGKNMAEKLEHGLCALMREDRCLREKLKRFFREFTGLADHVQYVFQSIVQSQEAQNELHAIFCQMRESIMKSIADAVRLAKENGEVKKEVDDAALTHIILSVPCVVILNRMEDISTDFDKILDIIL